MKIQQKNKEINSNLEKFHASFCPELTYDDPAFFYLLLKHLKNEMKKENFGIIEKTSREEKKDDL